MRICEARVRYLTAEIGRRVYIRRLCTSTQKRNQRCHCGVLPWGPFLKNKLGSYSVTNLKVTKSSKLSSLDNVPSHHSGAQGRDFASRKRSGAAAVKAGWSCSWLRTGLSCPRLGGCWRLLGHVGETAWLWDRRWWPLVFCKKTRLPMRILGGWYGLGTTATRNLETNHARSSYMHRSA